MEPLLAGEIELAGVARLVLAAGQLDRGLGGLQHLAPHGGDLLGAEQRVVRDARVVGEGEHLIADAELGRLELGRRHPLPRGDHEEIEEVQLDAEAVPQRPRRRGEGKADATRERRVLEETGLDEVGLGDHQLLVGALERRVVEQRDLHRAPHRERAREHVPHAHADGGVLLAALVPDDLEPAALLHRAGHVREARLLRDRAPTERHGRDQDGRAQRES